MASSSPEEKESPTTELNTKDLNEESSGRSETKSPTLQVGEQDSQVAADSTATDGKVNLILKPTADVPIMKKKRWQVDETKTIQWVITFIKKYLKLEDKDTIFLYVAQAFAPPLDQQIKNLYDSFGTDGKLVLHYSKTPAWG